MLSFSLASILPEGCKFSRMNSDSLLTLNIDIELDGDELSDEEIFAKMSELPEKVKIDFLTLGDFVAPLVPIGLGAGRLGNFINAELWGRTTDVSWGVIFPGAGALPRHPSQLYEFALEGVLLFVILWGLSAKPNQ